MGPALSRGFFERPTARVARALLGATLWVRDRAGVRCTRIVETEAYVARDPASHAYRGPTPRNRSMFLRAGTLYVYRIHQVVCANVVTRPGEAVLLRAGAPGPGVVGPASGPGRLCRSLGITIEDDGADAAGGPRLGFTAGAPPARIRVGPRVGIRRARSRPLRFQIDGEQAVSRPRWGRAATSASPSRSRAAGERRRSRTRRRPSSAGGRSGGRTSGR